MTPSAESQTRSNGSYELRGEEIRQRLRSSELNKIPAKAKKHARIRREWMRRSERSDVFLR